LIALSGSDDEADKLRCKKIGFDAFIAKPIKKSEIVSVFSNF
jgi:CheY-like chemotaxis protein